MTLGRVLTGVGALSALALCWVGAHYARAMPASPWPASTRTYDEADNGFRLVTGNIDTPDALGEMLDAAPEDRARVFRENEISIDRALRETETLRAALESSPRFALSGDLVIQALFLWEHRTVAVYVEPDPERAVARARSLWRHSADAAETCTTAVGCALSAKMTEMAMSAAESVVRHFGTSSEPRVQRELSDLRREVASAFEDVPTMAVAIEGEYAVAREAIEAIPCVPFDRGQTEAVLRDYYRQHHDYAAGIRSTPGPDDPADEFFILYNPCGRAVARAVFMDLTQVIDKHTETFEDVALRQRAFD